MRNIDNITKTLRRPFAGAALCALALAGALSVTGCRKQGIPASKGDGVLFSASVSGSESGTKTAYSGVRDKEKPEIAESILWQTGDEIRIWCAECSEPTTETYGGADHWADYTVTPDETNKNKAKIATRTGTVGLRWSEAESMPTHYFYAVYPSPGISLKDDTWSLGTISTGTEKATPFTFTGHIPASQAISGDLTTGKDPSDNTKNLTVAAPDMKNLYMVSKAEAKPVTETGTKAGEENSVFLNFRPLSTAIQFTIQNDMTAEGAMMQVDYVKIMSDPKTGTAKNLSGAFVADLATEWKTPTTVTAPTGSGIIGSYNNPYPSCTEGTTGMSPAVSIDFKNTTACTTGIARGDRLQFTFFLLPTQSVDDLSFVIKRADDVILKTRLEMADGAKIPFPMHKKTYVKGILVPDGAVWTISFDPTVTPWGSNDGDSADGEMVDPITETTPIVTEWVTVDFEPEFQ